MNTLSSLLNFIGINIGVLEFTVANVSALPITITDSKITDKHICTSAILSDSSAQTNDWTCTTTDGQAVISGTNAISGTTDVTIRLELKTN